LLLETLTDLCGTNGLLHSTPGRGCCDGAELSPADLPHRPVRMMTMTMMTSRPLYADPSSIMIAITSSCNDHVASVVHVFRCVLALYVLVAAGLLRVSHLCECHT
jgi:hypothetical protein